MYCLNKYRISLNFRTKSSFNHNATLPWPCKHVGHECVLEKNILICLCRKTYGLGTWISREVAHMKQNGSRGPSRIRLCMFSKSSDAISLWLGWHTFFKRIKRKSTRRRQFCWNVTLPCKQWGDIPACNSAGQEVAEDNILLSGHNMACSDFLFTDQSWNKQHPESSANFST